MQLGIECAHQGYRDSRTTIRSMERLDSGAPMATLDIKPAATEPQLNLLMPKGSLDQPLWKSLFHNLDDFSFPKKQAPLVLTSKPVPVKDIWGFYDYKKNGALGSTLVHVVLIGAIIGLTLLG